VTIQDLRAANAETKRRHEEEVSGYIGDMNQLNIQLMQFQSDHGYKDLQNQISLLNDKVKLLELENNQLTQKAKELEVTKETLIQAKETENINIIDMKLEMESAKERSQQLESGLKAAQQV
jgi:hypothetical protein